MTIWYLSGGVAAPLGPDGAHCLHGEAAGLLGYLGTSSPLDMPKGLGRGYFFPTVPPANAR